MNSLSIKNRFFIAATIALFAVFMTVPAGSGGIGQDALR